ncbi:MAG: RNA 2',3'-cyclic phosphodiesterase [Firmicutes bacterium]|nr:RNA 2',3'-cyclic phosphodiesterase [Bacillota bacterium]
MRLFIAIQLSEKLKGSARDVQETFRWQQVRGNYTPAENLHLTLAFIGEYGNPEEVLDAMERIKFAPFTIRMDKIGCFNDLWWTGFADSRELADLVRNLRHALAEAGILYDRKKFKAHCTVLRKAQYAKGGQPVHMSIEPADMQVGRICLMQSTRGKHGMIYTELGSVEAQ